MSKDALKQLSDYPGVSFIAETSFDTLRDKMISDYQKRYRELTGKEIQLAAADPYRLILYSCAVAIYQGYQYEDKAGKMGLLKYSTGDYLENLAALKGVIRNEAKPSQTTIRFRLSTTLNRAAIIPAGTRVKGMDLYFQTFEQGVILAGQEYTDITAYCQTLGSTGNGYLAGDIKTLVDPLPYTLSVENTVPTFGGADKETDAELAERVYLAPSSFSTAGPEQAYQYWAKSYNTEIGECRVVSESPGEVDIYITLNNNDPSEILPSDSFIEKLTAYLNDSSVRPLTDHVVVKKPEAVGYDINYIYYVKTSDMRTLETIEKAVLTATDNYVIWQQSIGRDINPQQLQYEIMKAGAHSVNIIKPEYTELTNSQIAIVKAKSGEYGGLKNG